jgi:uncharacterized protein
MKTKLWHELPAILKDGEWIVISADFKNIVKIPEAEIDSPEVFNELESINFFQRDLPAKNVFQLTLITTSDCNLKCRYCFANSGESNLVMSEDLMKAAIDYGLEKSLNKTLSIAFFGGEPSLTGELIKKAVDYAEANISSQHKGVEFSITTNGLMSQKFLQFLIDKKFKITLSADGPAFIQDYQRPTKEGGPSSIFVERTIQKLAEANANFKLRVTVTDRFVQEMTTIVEWYQKLGGKQIHFEPVTISGRALKAGELVLKQPDAESFIEGLQAAILKGCELDVGVINSSFMNISNPPPEYCEGHAEKRISISYTGDITTCVEVQDRCHPASKNFIIGHYEEGSGKIVMEKERRGESPCSGVTLNGCQDCFALRVCGGGCPVRNFHATGSMESIDGYRCQTIKAMVPFVVLLCDDES